MATRNWTHDGSKTNLNLYTSTALANGDDSQPVETIYSGDRTVQVDGTFGTGGTAIVEGSLDGVTYSQLRDPAGTLISFTAAGIRSVMEFTPYLRVRVTAGDGTTNLAARVAVRRN